MSKRIEGRPVLAFEEWVGGEQSVAVMLSLAIVQSPSRFVHLSVSLSAPTVEPLSGFGTRPKIYDIRSFTVPGVS